MTKQKLLLLTIVFFLPSLLPAQKAQWWKGNLHTHSYWSDGDDYPEMILDWYKTHDYHFVALSEHNILAEGEKWVTLRKRRYGAKAFKQYLNRFGKDWVSYKIENGDTLVQLKTLAEYRTQFEEPQQFLVIKSEEITDRYQDKPIHVNATNIQQLVQPKHGKTLVEVMQNNINAVLAQREETGIPMFPHINHPNFGWAITKEEMAQLKGERFFEVYNGHPAVRNVGDDGRSGTEEMWDHILTAYLRNGQPIMYGLAVDDSHNYHKQAANMSNTGRGWVMVRSTSLSPDSLITALERGDFYSTSGVELKKIQRKGNKLKIQVKPKAGITYRISFIGATDQETGKVFTTIEGKKATYTFTGNELYVRAKIVSSKLQVNPIEAGMLETAWTQPELPK